MERQTDGQNDNGKMILMYQPSCASDTKSVTSNLGVQNDFVQILYIISLHKHALCFLEN